MLTLCSENHPCSLTDAIKLIANNLDEGEREYIIMNGAEGLHHSAGTAIRNAWLYPKGSILRAHFVHNFGDLLHEDDMSNMILAGVTAMVRKVHFDPLILAEQSREYYRTIGLNPNTGEKL